MNYRRFFLAIAITLLVASPAAADSLEEVMGKMYDARGGLKHIKAVESARFSGMFVIPGMMEAPMTMEWKRPAKLRMSFDTPQGSGAQVFDGEKGWAMMPGTAGPQEMNAEQVDAMRLEADVMDGPLVDWQDKGNVVEYLGEADLEGTAVHQLKLTGADGRIVTISLDATTFLPIRQSGVRKIQGMETEVETYIGDYKKVGALTLAHSVKNEMIDIGMTQEVILETIELDVDLPDDRFAMPAAEAAPAGD